MNSDPKKDFIKDLLHHLSAGQVKEACESMADFAGLDVKTQNRALFEISMAPSDDAFFIMEALLKKTEESEIKKRLLGIVLDKARLNPEFILLFVADADKAMLQEAVPVLANILITETDVLILTEAIKAIGHTGSRSCVNVVADFIFYDDPELKTAAVMALEEIGGGEVVKRLEFALQTSKSDDFIRETLERLKAGREAEAPEINGEKEDQYVSQKDMPDISGEESAVRNLIAMLDSPSFWDVKFASDKLIEMGTRMIPSVSTAMAASSPGALVNLLFILGSINNEAAVPVIMKVIESGPEKANVRFAAYDALSRITSTTQSTSIVNGLSDPVEHVRMAAARAVDTNLSDILVEGILTGIDTGGRKSRRTQIVEAIIDGRAGKAIRRLFSSDSFVFLATNYLQTAAPSTKKYVADILTERGTHALARRVAEEAEAPEENNRRTIFLVDRSPIMLQYYLKELHKTGHRGFVFRKPDEALMYAEEFKPDLLITGSRLANISGEMFAAQFKSKIRAWHNGTSVPAVISCCTEENPVPGEIIAECITPPFSGGELKSIIKRLT